MRIRLFRHLLPNLPVLAIFFAIAFASGSHRGRVSGQERAEVTREAKPVAEANPVTLDQIQTVIQQIQSDATIAPGLKQSLLQTYDAILVELRAKAENERLAKELAASAEAAPSATSEMKRRKEIPPARDLISESALRAYPLQALQELLQTQKTNLQAATDGRTKAEADITAREARKKDLPRSITEERAKLLELNERLTAPGTAAEIQEPRQREAETLLLRAQIASLSERIRKREQELRVYEAESELLTLKKAVFATDERYFQGRVKEVVDELNKRRETKIEEEKRKAVTLATSTPPKLKWLSDSLVKRAADWLELAKRNTAIELDIERSNAELKSWEERYRMMTDRSKGHSDPLFGGISHWNGLVLRRHRNELLDEGKLQRQLNEYLDRMQQTETLIIELEDWKNRHSGPLAVTDSVEDQVRPAIEEDDPGLLKQVDKLLSAERELVNSFIMDAKDYSDNLFELSESKQATIRLTKKYRAFIDQHILWIRSAKPVGFNDLQQVWPALQYTLDIRNWRNAALVLARDLQEKLWQPLLFVVLWMVLLLNATKLRRGLAALGGDAARPTTTDFASTAQALCLTLLLSAPWPLLLLCLGYRLYQVDGTQPFTHALGMGFMLAARYFYPLELVRQICRRGGLAENHFGWQHTTTALIRRHLRWLIDLGVPTTALCAFVFDLGEDRFEHSLGRIAFAFLMLLCSLFLAIVLRPSHGVFRDYLSEHPGGWADRLRYVWYLGLTLGPLLLCFNSLNGFHYTAVRLSMLCHTTLVMVVGLFLLYQVIRRWLLLSHRKLMTDQARQRLEEVQQRELTGGNQKFPMPIHAASESATQEFTSSSKQLDLVEINAQTMRLSLGVLTVAGIVGMGYIWSGVLPAVNVFNSVTLWTVQGATASDQVPITLASLLWAIPILVLTFVGARNLPGLLEIALLQHLPFQNSVRYAIATLSRYAIVLIGISLTFNSIGVRWVSIQWLVAALGVGLGFGLQEIFANFVSGLILLFEQPIRVGDVITLGETTGSVSRIRMRATTITNWDRQELIIPNKDLITGRLLNWTLSDSTNRLVIEVGIAYASDPEQACQMILDICRDHENILSDPPPTAHVDTLGDSAINIKIRVFLENLDTRVDTRHQLQTAIHRRFFEAGIEIAFPQRDLHLRSIPSTLAEFLNRHGKSADPAN